jgi:hypothetical protein
MGGSGSGSDKANAIAAIDLLLNLLMLFIVVSAIAVVQMNKPAQEKSVDLKAELVVELTWADRNFSDLDLWVMLPNGRKVGFIDKDAGVATLDRDDRGAVGDIYQPGPGDPKVIPVNKESTVIRANLPGRYVVNVHYFHRPAEADVGLAEMDSVPDPVVVKLTKLNPRLAELANRKITLGKVGSQRTAFCFELEAGGSVTNVDITCDAPFVPTGGETARGGTSEIAARSSHDDSRPWSLAARPAANAHHLLRDVVKRANWTPKSEACWWRHA